MALTTPDDLPYPTDYADPADTPAALEELANATQVGLTARAYASDFGTWKPYSPVLSQHNQEAVTSAISARYMQSGNLVVVQVDVRSQSNIGNPSDPWIRCTLPVPARNAPAVPIGQGRYAAPESPKVWRFHVNLFDTTHVAFEATHLETATHACIGEDPWHTLTAGDAVQFAAVYEAL